MAEGNKSKPVPLPAHQVPLPQSVCNGLSKSRSWDAAPTFPFEHQFILWLRVTCSYPGGVSLESVFQFNIIEISTVQWPVQISVSEQSASLIDCSDSLSLLRIRCKESNKPNTPR